MTIKSQLPTNLKTTLLELEGTLAEWEKIAPDVKEHPATEDLAKSEKELMELELHRKAKIILDKLKSQIEELSE